MKISIEIEFNVDGEITPERAVEVFISEIPVFIVSEDHGDGEQYALEVVGMRGTK